MKHHLLLSAVAVLCLALPAAALAQPGGPDTRDHQNQAKHSRRGDKPGAPAPVATPAPVAATGVVAPSGGAGPGGARRATSHTQTHQQGQTGGPQAGQGQAVRTFTPPAATPQHRSRPTFSGGQTQQPTTRGPQIRLPPAPPPLGAWNRTARGPDRDQAGQQWRQGHQGWDRSAPWRQSQNWWRRDSGFRLFFGPRIGFFFIPEFGYVQAPTQYRDHYWRTGEYLPNWFWRYEVRDYRRYGLPTPPDGCVWVWVDGDVALIDRSDGYIVDIVHNLW